MNCGRCGRQIGDRIIRYNGVILCENCARDLGVDEAIRSQATLFGQAFPLFEELTNSIVGGHSDLEFANTKIRCPRCKMTLREFETGGQAGCIECYNTFNETIIKAILKRQGSSSYKGRKPGEEASISDTYDEPAETSENTEVNNETPEKNDKRTDLLEYIRSMGVEKMEDSALEEGMKLAAAAEDYALAVKIRDELKKRKEDK